MIDGNWMTPEDRKWIALGVASAALSALVTGGIAWGFDEMKRMVAERREKKKAKEPT